MRFNKVLAWLLVASMSVMLLPTTTLAANGGDTNVLLVATRNAGTAAVGISIVDEQSDGTASFEIDIKNMSNGVITVDWIAQASSSILRNVDNGIIPAVTIASGATQSFTINCDVRNEGAAGLRTESLDVQYTIGGIPTECTVTFPFRKSSTPAAASTDSGTTTDPVTTTDTPNILVLSPTGVNGSAVSAPKGNAGESIQLRLPIYNRGSKSTERATDITVSPVISTSLDSFPFVIEEVDYTRNLPDMKMGSTQEIVYNFKLSKEATTGVKEVKFNIVYYNRAKQAYETASVSVFVTVVKGKDPLLTDTEGEVVTTTPKVIIESYSVAPVLAEGDEDTDRLFAGAEFALTLVIRNTSAEESVKNIQVRLSNETGFILPANNGSNSFYISRIDSGEKVEHVVQMQISPDAEAKAQAIGVKFNYESSKTLKAYEVTENISLPVSQRLRVRVDDPMLYGEATMEQETAMYFSLYNMGRSSLFNCMVDIEGEGMRMLETYYGGTVSGGSQMRADFVIVPSVAGEIEAIVVVTFEDEYGEQTRIEKPMTISVIDPAEMMGGEELMPGMEGGLPSEGMDDPGVGTGIPTWLIYAGAGVLVAALVVVLVVVKRKRRKKILEAV